LFTKDLICRLLYFTWSILLFSLAKIRETLSVSFFLEAFYKTFDNLTVSTKASVA